jgi:YVTN family beta-propeller protein
MKPLQACTLFLVVSATALAVGVSTGWSASPAGQGDGFLLVANKGDKSMGIIDPTKSLEIARVPEDGVTGHEVTASPDGKTAYVPIYGDSGVGRPGSDGRHMVVIDLATRKIKATVDFGKGVRPHDPVFNPKDGFLYVTTELNQTVSIIDPGTLQIIGSVPTGQEQSHMLAISRDGRRGYTANVGPGTVSVLDLEHRETLTIIPISKNTQRISISIDDKFVFTSDQTSPRLAVIDTKTNAIARWVTLPDIGYGTAPTPDGKYLVIALFKANKVAVLDLKTFQVAQVIDVPAAPQAAVVRPDGKMVYVSCDKDHKVAAIRTSDWKVDSLIDSGAGTDGLAWAGTR